MAERGAWTRRRMLETAFAAAVAAMLLYCAWGAWRDRQLPRRLERIHLGMDGAAAQAVMGRPDWEGECGRRTASLPRQGCAREIGYASAFAPVYPAYYLIQLDSAGRVIEAEAVAVR